MEDQEGHPEGSEDDEDMVFQPDLIAAAEQMGVELDPGQLKLLRAYLAEQAERGDNGEGDEENEESEIEQPEAEQTDDDIDEVNEEQ